MGYTDSGLFVYDYPPKDVESADPTSPVVVMVHGSMDRGTSFIRVRNCLRTHHVVTYDRRGYHRSRGHGRTVDTTFPEQVDDLLEVLDGRDAVVFGHSYGGLITLTAAAVSGGPVRAAVVFEAPLVWEPWWPGLMGQRWHEAPTPADAAEWFIRRMVGDDRWERLPARTREERRLEGDAFVSEARALRAAGMPFDPAAIAVPVIVARGSRTRAHQIRGTTELAASIPGAELAEIPGAAHAAHLTHAAAVAELIGKVAVRADATAAALPGVRVERRGET